MLSELSELLPYLTAQELAELDGLLAVKGLPANWAPLPRQLMALETTAFETLYGGAAGGGKSDLLLGLAHRHRRALLLRRTFPDLERSLILRSMEMYGDAKNYNGSKHVWRWGTDRRIEFGHLEYDKNVYQYQSAQYDLIGFDELTQFTKFQYEYMISRARSTIKGQRVRLVACTNPGGEGNEWVMERWAAWLDEGYPRPAQSGEVRWFKRDESGRDVETTPDDPDGISRTFIAAKLSDNPFLDDSYRRTLNALPDPYRSQLLDGNWQAGLTDDAYQVLPTAWIRAAQARWTPDGGGDIDSVGVDVARGGDDQTVFVQKSRSWFGRLHKIPGRRTPDGQSVVAALIPLLPVGARAKIDVIGVGASAYDIARSSGLSVIPVNFAEGSDETDKSGRLHFINKRAELYWRLREALDPSSGDDVMLPPDPELLADLKSARWEVTIRGIKVIDKETIKKQLGRSPDCADAVVIASARGGWLMY